jgi:parallel beta-helix repeat protein
MNSRVFSVSGVLVVLLALVLAMPASAGQANVLRVGPGEKYATIQAAVNAASQGSRILVYPGIYNEAVVITKSNLQILAQGEHVNVQPDVFPTDDRAGFVVLADNVTIRGFNIGFGGGCFAAIYFKGSHNTFADNYMFQDEDCLGINAVNGRSSTGGNDYNVIEGNTIYHADLGIAIGADSGYLNKGNIIRDNIISAVFTTPIAIQNGDGFLVSGNRIDGGTYCIDVGTWEGKQPVQGHHTIVGNYMTGCGQEGIWVYANPLAVMTGNRIAGNTILGCLNRCIALTAYAGATMSNNEVSSNSIDPSGKLLPTSANGIVLEVNPLGAAPLGAVSNNNLIQGNRVAYGGNAIVLEKGADRNRITKNEVRSNLLKGITVFGDNNSIVGNVAKENGTYDLADEGEGNRWVNNTYNTKNW